MSQVPLTGTRIRERRIHLGVRQADLARAAGISASYLNLIEHNRRRIGAEVLARLAGALGVETGVLSGEAEAGLADTLREAAAQAGPPRGPAAEVDQIEDFAGRFPGWAGLVVQQHDRLSQLDRAIEALSDRMSHDPHLSAVLHEILSAATAVRATAAILSETPDIDPDWRQRFERNLAEDSGRLAEGAEALAGYLDGVAAEETGLAAPQEELEAWLTGQDWHLPALEEGAAPESLIGGAAELASVAARRLALDWMATYREDAARLPLAPFLAGVAELGPDPGRLAGRFGVDPAAVFRRLATLPADAGAFGLVVCDGSGTLIQRKPLPGFGLPRFGAACPLWPLYLALAHPALPIRRRVDVAGRLGARFLALAWCQPVYPEGFDGAPVMRAYMLILPDTGPEGAAGGPVTPVGVSCRICPRRDCAARREPAIMGEGRRRA
ncbi:helix-turn-helix domain-containing protein [Ruixingdingia sedimenti]|uniref:Short-chain fatty acyl-CoA regulator family protein n=1 Tax=Ruixingdingia sedimenti TaxID=3073604 RepID=A0ABU1F610_9RHOB|nr:helix-turn-helix domain-containing protein [Xinfangfangia sp. LG-4]MDR5652309.1 short-chain fatty acyl-CoA regulator family protein [Xinfangfangia sp. LG-4]